MTVIQKKAVNPIAHLSAEDIEIIGKELDAIRTGSSPTGGSGTPATSARWSRPSGHWR